LAQLRLNFDNEINRPTMSSIIEGYSYDIFISYRQNDNKYDGWVTEFVDNLNKELEATIKNKISVYFDINPHNGLLETHSVNLSLEDKLKCLVFIPIISSTYCDSKSFAWQHEFCAFNKLSKEDKFGRDIKIAGGNVASRILPIKIHDLDHEDKELLENELGGVLRAIEFIYKSAGVNRPLRSKEENPHDNLNHILYRDQINKVANAVKEIITAIKKHSQQGVESSKEVINTKPEKPKVINLKLVIAVVAALALIVLGYLFIPKLLKSSESTEKSVAVLPFVNLSNDPEQEYFSDGMVDEILDRLFKVGDLKVIARTSSMRYKNTKLTLKEIAHELGVSTLLEGSVQKFGNKIRITVQLIDPKTSFHLWSETFNRDLSDVFLIQSEVAQNVARELKATLTFKEKTLIQSEPITTNQLAYDFYLRGKDYWSKYDIAAAISMYSKAIQEDTLFTAAYAQRATTHLYLYWNRLEGWQGEDLKAKEDIKTGLQLNPELPEIRLAEAVAFYYLDRDYNRSIEILNELKTEAPNMADLYAYISYNLRRQGKWEESINELKQAVQLDPFNGNYIYNLSNTYQILHKYDNEIENYKQGLSLIPDYKDFSSNIFLSSLKKTGDLKLALKESGLKEEDAQFEVYYYTRQYFKSIEYLSKQIAYTSTQFHYMPLSYQLALIYFLSGNKTQCEIYTDSAIAHLKGKIKENPYDDRLYSTLGKCYAFNGKYRDAIAYGKKAVDMKPVRLDPYLGINKEQDLMEIYLFTGNWDMALDKIEYLLSVPSWLSTGDLLIDPIYDNLRKLPRFQKIINSAKSQSKMK
jgi:TolB-like protein/predicted Zn-dependent protease